MISRSQNLVLPTGTDALLRNLIHERTGIFFDNGKSDQLIDKLSPLVIERGFSSFLDYYYLLKYDEMAQVELQSVMNALSVQETYFWREIDQIRALVQTIVPLWQTQHGDSTLRIWSAACASGEEPLTIAMALNEAGWFERLKIELHATDGSSTAIARAKQGGYRDRAFRNLPDDLRERYFTRDPSGSSWLVRKDIHSRIKWGVANLVDEHQIIGVATADIIFCRNVFIYFSDSAIRRTVNSFAKFMRPPGYLFIGTSESLVRLGANFTLTEIDGAFLYVRHE